jgi:hypothetical protein
MVAFRKSHSVSLFYIFVWRLSIPLRVRPVLSVSGLLTKGCGSEVFMTSGLCQIYAISVISMRA